MIASHFDLNASSDDAFRPHCPLLDLQYTESITVITISVQTLIRRKTYLYWIDVIEIEVEDIFAR